MLTLAPSTRRRLLIDGGAWASALLLAGPARAAGAEPERSISYWHHFTSQSEFAGLQRVIALFEERHPGIKIVQENIPNAEFMAKFTSAVVSASRPDATMITAERLADMVALGGLVDLTERIDDWGRTSSFRPDAFRGATVETHPYGVPAFAFVNWMYYRRDWFDEAGIARPPDTMDEMLEVALKITDRAKGRYGFGLRGGDGGHGFVIDLIRAWGSPVIEDGKVAIDRDKAIAAVGFYSDLYTKYGVVPPSVASDSYRQIMEGFRTGQTGMIWHHTGSLREIAGALPRESFSTAIRPTGPAARIAQVSYLYNGLMKRENIDAAWAWVSFWGEPEPAIAMLEETGYFPASKQVADDPRILSDPLYLPAAATLEFGVLPLGHLGAEAWARNVVMPEFQKILIGAATPEAAVDAMIRGLERTLN
jgi:multiple sugar transport system substrate-binding protein